MIVKLKRSSNFRRMSSLGDANAYTKIERIACLYGQANIVCSQLFFLFPVSSHLRVDYAEVFMYVVVIPLAVRGWLGWPRSSDEHSHKPWPIVHPANHPLRTSRLLEAAADLK